MEIAQRVNSLAQKESDPALIMGAYRSLAEPLYSSGDFERARDYAIRAIQIWRSGVQSPVEEVDLPVVTCLTTMALCQWHFGEIDRSKATIAEAISLARDLNDMWPSALAIFIGGILARLENNFSEVESSALELVELSTRCNFATSLTLGSAHRNRFLRFALSISSCSIPHLLEHDVRSVFSSFVLCHRKTKCRQVQIGKQCFSLTEYNRCKRELQRIYQPSS